MKAIFEELGKIGKYGRYGYFTTRRGRVYTPTFMPDGTRGVVKSLLPEQVKATGVQVILANTYHLHLQPGEKVIKKLGGLHAFGGWQGPILTDSGGFQVFSLGKNRVTDSALRSVSVRQRRAFEKTKQSLPFQKAAYDSPGSTEQGVQVYDDVSTGLGKPKMAKKLAVSDAPHLSRQAGAGFVKVTEEGVTFKHPTTGEKRLITPESSIQIQLDLGADMLVAFDHLIGLDKTSKEDVKDAFERTHRWLERCTKEFNRLTKDMKPSDRPILFGVVQGGLDLELRTKSLGLVQASDVGGIAIGGLSVGEGQKAMFKVLSALAPLYEADRPRFLLGVGEPADLRFAYENGIDMADCVLPTRNARHATVWTHKPCTCAKKPSKAVLSGASRAISDLDSSHSSPRRTPVRLGKIAQNNIATSLDCKVCGEKEEKMHLTNAQYISDPKVIMPGCDCFTCSSGYSRAFLRHQFKVGEPVAGSLASIHNLRYLERMCEQYRTT